MTHAGPSSTPAVSVIVAFYNRRDEVSICLESIMAQELPTGAGIEIVAVDNGSTDGTRQLLTEYPVRIVDCSVRGPAAARNAGVRAARAPIVAMTDSDCVTEPGWLTSLIEPFSDPEVLGAGGRIDALSVDTGVALFAEKTQILNQGKLFSGVFCFPPFFATANAAYRRDIFEKVGGFDENLRVGEDSDLTWRVLDLGGRIAYCPGAVVRHGHRETFREFFHQAIGYGIGAATVFAKHRKRFGVRYIVEWDNILALAMLPVMCPLRILLAKSSIGRKWCLYEALWRTGFTIGRIRGSHRNHVLFI